MNINNDFQAEVAENLLYQNQYVEWSTERIGEETWMKILVQNDDGLESEYIFRDAGEFKGRSMLEVKLYTGSTEPIEVFVEATPIAFTKIIAHS